MSKKIELNKTNIDQIKPTGKIFRVWDTLLNGYHIRVSKKGKIAFALRYHNADRNLDYTIGIYGDITPQQARAKAEKARGKARADGVDLLQERKDENAAKRAEIEKQKKDKLRTLGIFYEQQYLPWAETNIKSLRELKRLMKVEFVHLLTMDMKDISPWHVQLISKKAQKKGLKYSSINRRITTLKAILSKAVEWKVIPSSQLTGLKKLREDKTGRVRYLSADEEKRLFLALEAREKDRREKRDSHTLWAQQRHIDPPPLLKGKYTDHLYPIVLVALNTGMRMGEIFNLTWGDVDLKGRQLTVVGSGSKSGNSRHIDLNDDVFAALIAWRNQTESKGLVFPSPMTGKRLNNIKSSWTKVLKSAQIENFRFHDCRHDFASKLVMAGAELNTVRELLGHADLKMTIRYAHLAPEHKAKAVALLNRK